MPEAPGFPSEYRRKLLGYLLHLMGDPGTAEDVLRNLSGTRLELPVRPADAFAYLRGIARRSAMEHPGFRARANEVLRRWTEWAWESDEEEPSAEEDRGRQLRALRQCRERLQPYAAGLVSLRYDQGLETKAIARALGRDEGATRVMLLRARRALARCIQGRMREESTP